MYRIRRHENAPPGQYYFKIIFKDGKEEWFFGRCTGTPSCYLFGPSPTIGEPARRLSAFRTANGLPRANITEASEDIDSYTCHRLSNAGAWCYDTDKPYGEVNPGARPPVPCATCGHKLQ